VYGSDISMDKYQTINPGKLLGFLPLGKNKTLTRLLETQKVDKDDERSRQEKSKIVFMKWRKIMDRLWNIILYQDVKCKMKRKEKMQIMFRSSYTCT